MKKRRFFLIGLGACLALVACKSGPSSSASDRTAEQEQAGTLERRVDFLESLVARRHAAARVFDELMGALPDRVRLTEVLFSPEGIQVKGDAPTNNLLADYLTRLEGSSVITGAFLKSSVQRTGRAAEYQEFTIQARESARGGGESASSGSPEARLEALRKLFPGRQENAEILREIQRLAVGAGLRMTRFAPGNEIPGEFCVEWPISIGVEGSPRDLGDYLRGLAGLPRLWLVNGFSSRAVDPRDARSDVRASIAARTFFLR